MVGCHVPSGRCARHVSTTPTAQERLLSFEDLQEYEIYETFFMVLATFFHGLGYCFLMAAKSISSRGLMRCCSHFFLLEQRKGGSALLRSYVIQNFLCECKVESSACTSIEFTTCCAALQEN